MEDLKFSAASDKKFENHPEGTFMAVCRDIWVQRKPNPRYPGTTPWGKPEQPETVKVRIEFLTDEPIEINGKMLNRFVMFSANPSWHEDSALRQFVMRWNPAVGKADQADLEALVGKGAYLTITHNAGKDGRVYANCSAAPPPKGATIPVVPADFVRHKDRPADGAAPVTSDPPAKYTPQPAPPPVAEGDDDLPF